MFEIHSQLNLKKNLSYFQASNKNKKQPKPQKLYETQRLKCSWQCQYQLAGLNERRRPSYYNNHRNNNDNNIL